MSEPFKKLRHPKVRFSEQDAGVIEYIANLVYDHVGLNDVIGYNRT